MRYTESLSAAMARPSTMHTLEMMQNAQGGELLQRCSLEWVPQKSPVGSSPSPSIPALWWRHRRWIRLVLTVDMRQNSKPGILWNGETKQRRRSELFKPKVFEQFLQICPLFCDYEQLIPSTYSQVHGFGNLTFQIWIIPCSHVGPHGPISLILQTPANVLRHSRQESAGVEILCIQQQRHSRTPSKFVSVEGSFQHTGHGRNFFLYLP